MLENKLALLYLMLTFAAFPALGHPPPGANPNSEIYKWFDRQENINNQGCCGEGDGHILEADEIRTTNGDMEIQVEGHWFRVARWMMLKKALTDPNPTGKPVAWWVNNDPNQPNGIHVYCVALPWLA